jgi:hypothetical protein
MISQRRSYQCRRMRDLKQIHGRLLMASGLPPLLLFPDIVAFFIGHDSLPAMVFIYSREGRILDYEQVSFDARVAMIANSQEPYVRSFKMVAGKIDDISGTLGVKAFIAKNAAYQDLPA